MQKIPDKVLKNLEKKITNRVVAKIEEIVQYFLDYPYLVYPAFDYPSIGSDNNL